MLGLWSALNWRPGRKAEFGDRIAPKPRARLDDTDACESVIDASSPTVVDLRRAHAAPSENVDAAEGVAANPPIVNDE
jgi:hypothetical protein